MRKRSVVSSRPRYGSDDHILEGSGVYPDESPLSFSNYCFPYNAETMAVGDLPFGFIARPFILHNSWYVQKDPTVNMGKAIEAARCVACGGYINIYSELSASRWYCSVCGKRNVIDDNQLRYRNVDPRILSEVNDNVAEFKMPLDSDGKHYSMSSRERPLVQVFVIQENMSVDAIQSTVDAISKALLEVHPDIHVLIVTYSNRVGIHCISKHNGALAVQYSYFGSNTEEGTLEGVDHATNSNAEYILTVPLDDIANFWDTSIAIGDNRSAVINAVQTICDMALNDTRNLPASENVSLGSLLLSIYNWLADSAVSKRSRKGSAIPQTFDMSKLWHVFNNEAGLVAPFEPADVHNRCTGVLLHVFTDSAQPINRHTVLDDLQLHAVDSIDNLSKLFAGIDVSVSLWGIAAFDSTELGLIAVMPLVQRTGGELHRIVLGVDRQQSAYTFTEEIARTICRRYATRCMMKVRFSPALECARVTGTGLFPDDLDELLKVPVMTTDSTWGYQLAFRNGPSGSLAEDGMDPHAGLNRSTGRHARERTFVIQVAVSFETLVEDVVKEGHDGVVETTTSLISSAHIDYLKQSLKSLGLESLDDDLLREIIQEPAQGTNIAQKSSKRRSQLYCSQGYRPYSFQKALQVVKVLRVITIGLDCTTRANIFLQSRDHVCSTMLLLRDIAERALEVLPYGQNQQPEESESLKAGVAEPSGAEDPKIAECRALIARTSSWGVEEIVNRVARTILAQYSMRLVIQNIQARDRMLDMENPPDADLIPPAIEDRKALLKETIAAASASEAVFLLSSAVLRLLAVIPEESKHEGPVLAPDHVAVLLYELITVGASIAELYLHPIFRPMNEDGSLVNGCTSLSRESMVRAGNKSFFLDCGHEMVIYRKSDRFRRPEEQVYPIAAEEQSNSEKTIVELAEHRAAVIQNAVGHIIRRLTQYPMVTQTFVAEQGTGSAAIITSHLLLDDDASQLPYHTLIDFALEVAASAM